MYFGIYDLQIKVIFLQFLLVYAGGVAECLMKWFPAKQSRNNFVSEASSASLLISFQMHPLSTGGVKKEMNIWKMTI